MTEVNPFLPYVEAGIVICLLSILVLLMIRLGSSEFLKQMDEQEKDTADRFGVVTYEVLTLLRSSKPMSEEEILAYFELSPGPEPFDVRQGIRRLHLQGDIERDEAGNYFVTQTHGDG